MAARLYRMLDPTQMGEDAARLSNELQRRVVGQGEAVEQIVWTYQVWKAGMAAPNRPIANFLFLGPTGTGKTRTVEALAETLVGDRRAVIKIDCGEFQHSHEIAKIVGSPPGYLGHKETHALLSQQALNQFHTPKCALSFVLFDEIEKASDSLWNLLLGILDKASLTLGDNRKVDFSNCMIFLTSNLGAREIAALARPGIGFTPAPEAKASRVEAVATAAARRKFTPEFMNRIDRTVVFRPLNEVAMRQILDLELADVQERVLLSSSTAPFVIALTEEAKRAILTNGFSAEYGARHLKRALERQVVHPLSNLISSGQIVGGDLVAVDAPSGGSGVFTFTVEDSEPGLIRPTHAKHPAA